MSATVVVVLAGLTLLLGAVGFGVYAFQQAKKNKAAVEAAKARFLEQVGYAYGGPMSALASDDGHRKLPEGDLVFHCSVTEAGGKTVTRQSWALVPSLPPRAHFRLVSRHLVGAGRAIESFFGPKAIRLGRTDAPPTLIGDPQLDARYVLYAHHPAAARAVLMQPHVRTALAGFTAVILDIAPDAIVFSDPDDQNFWVAYDGAGHSRFAMNPAPAVDVAARVHLAVHQLLVSTAGASAAIAGSSRVRVA